MRVGDTVIFKYPRNATGDHRYDITGWLTVNKKYIVIHSNNYGSICVINDQGINWWMTAACFELTTSTYYLINTSKGFINVTRCYKDFTKDKYSFTRFKEKATGFLSKEDAKIWYKGNLKRFKKLDIIERAGA